MAQKHLNIGAAPNDGTGDLLRDAFSKVEDNETELYNRFDANGKILTTNTKIVTAPSGRYAGITTQDAFNTKTNDLIKNQTQQLAMFNVSTATYMCKTEGWGGYNLIYVLSNTGAPPAICVFDMDKNFQQVATVTMPTGITNIDNCLFYEGALYINARDAANSGILKMTFDPTSTIDAPVFAVSSLKLTDGTTAIPNTSVGGDFTVHTIGGETRIITYYVSAGNIITHLVSLDITNNTGNLSLVQLQSLTTALYNLGGARSSYITKGSTPTLIFSRTENSNYSLIKFQFSSGFAFNTTATRFSINSVGRTKQITGDNNYVYVCCSNTTDTSARLIRIPNILLESGLDVLSYDVPVADLIYVNYKSYLNSEKMYISDNKLIMAITNNAAPFNRNIFTIDLDTFKLLPNVYDVGGYGATAGYNCFLFVKQRATDGIGNVFENVNLTLASSYSVTTVVVINVLRQNIF